MSKTIILTVEQEQDIVAMYTADSTLKEIEEKHGVSQPKIYKILAKHGVAKKMPQRAINYKKVCECGARMPYNANFCYVCGKELLTEEQKIHNNLLAARATCLKYVPENKRAEVDKQLMSGCDFFKNLAKKERNNQWNM